MEEEEELHQSSQMRLIRRNTNTHMENGDITHWQGANDPDNGTSELLSRSRHLRMAVEPVYCGQRSGRT
jgi:hypothetical protein